MHNETVVFSSNRPSEPGSKINERKEWESHYDFVVEQIGFELFEKTPESLYFDKLIHFAAGKANSLEFGSGKGGLSLALKRSLPKIDVHLLDFSQGAVEYSRRLFAHYGLNGSFTAGSFLDLPFDDNRFGIVHGNTVLEHVHDTGQAVKELVRVTEPNGYLLITVPNRRRRYDGHDLFHTAFGLKHFSKTFYLKELEQYFKNENCEIVDRFGTTLSFIAPSYFGLLALQILKRGLHGRSQPPAPNTAGIESDSSTQHDHSNYGFLNRLRMFYRKWLLPLRVLDKACLNAQIHTSRFADNHLKLPPEIFVTIGIVAKKLR